MANEEQYSKVVSELRGIATRFKPDQRTYDEIVKYRDEVLARYRPIFSSEHVSSLTKDEFTTFLYPENNRHWNGLYRKGLGAAEDMNVLRQGLAVLLDEDKPIQERLPKALERVAGLGKATATAILTVAYPDQYGVWNNTSEAALRQVGLWPEFEWGADIGKRYAKINYLLTRLAADLEMDFWTLDAFWWFVLTPQPVEPLPLPSLEDTSSLTIGSGMSFPFGCATLAGSRRTWQRTGKVWRDSSSLIWWKRQRATRSWPCPTSG